MCLNVRPTQTRSETRLVIASQSDLISLLRFQLHIHNESTLLVQRHFGDACTRSSAATAENTTPSPPPPVTARADAGPLPPCPALPT